MVEGNRLEVECLPAGDEPFPRKRPRQQVVPLASAQQRQQHGRLEGGELLLDLGDDRDTVVLLPPEAVAVDGQQDLGLDLRETVNHTADAELGRAARPHRPEAGGGQERDQRFRDVGQQCRHPVAPSHTETPQPGGRRSHLRRQFGVAEAAHRARFRGSHYRHMVVAAAQGMFRIVEFSAGEPASTGHGTVGEHLLVGAAADDVEVLPDRTPETLQVVYRPLP